MRKIIQCEDCEASYEIKHDLEERYYKVSFCPFCASKTDLMDDLEEEDEDEWDS